MTKRPASSRLFAGMRAVWSLSSISPIRAGRRADRVRSLCLAATRRARAGCYSTTRADSTRIIASLPGPMCDLPTTTFCPSGILRSVSKPKPMDWD